MEVLTPVERVTIPSEWLDYISRAWLEAPSLSANNLAEHSALGLDFVRNEELCESLLLRLLVGRTSEWGPLPPARFMTQLAQRLIPSRPSSAHESYLTSRDM